MCCMTGVLRVVVVAQVRRCCSLLCLVCAAAGVAAGSLFIHRSDPQVVYILLRTLSKNDAHMNEDGHL